MSNFLLDENIDLKKSSIYVGYIVLNELRKHDKLSMYELYGLLRKKLGDVSYANTMHGLVFLKMCGLIDFTQPYIIPVKDMNDTSRLN